MTSLKSNVWRSASDGIIYLTVENINAINPMLSQKDDAKNITAYDFRDAGVLKAQITHIMASNRARTASELLE